MVLFSCTLPVDELNTHQIKDILISRVDEVDLSQSDFARLINVWNRDTRARQINERFESGARLWLAKIDGQLTGYGWTIQGRTIKTHFFPLQKGDIHLFDFYVFPQWRGRGVNVALVKEVLRRSSEEQVHCAHIECAAWNSSQLRSLDKTAFRKYAESTKITIVARPVVIWHKLQTT